MLYVKFDKNDPSAVLKPLSQGTDEEILSVFNELLTEYKTGYAALKLLDRFKDNETYLEGKHWDLVDKTDENEPRPHTPVLWSTIDNIHADLVEAYPRANPEPERVSEEEKVRIVADIINSARYRRNYKAKWAQLMKGILTQGVDILEVLWDKTLYGGLGDVNFLRWSIRNVFFNPYVSDINESDAVIVITFEHERTIMGKYPDKRDKISNANDMGINITDLMGGTDTPAPANAAQMVMVARFFWREFTMVDSVAGAYPDYRLHWAKIAGNTVVERQKPNGDGTVPSLYRHGEYPFVPFTFEDKDGSLFPLSLVDRFKKMQWFVDLMDQAVVKNLLTAARKKLLVNRNSGIDVDALKDWKQDVVVGDGIGESDLRDFETPAFASGPFEYSKQKIDAMKDEAGANQFYRGEGGRGVTAASAIFALQDASGRRNKKTISRAYDADCKVSWLTAELMGEFYTEPRTLMIVDDQGKKSDLQISNAEFQNDAKNGLIDMRMRMSAEKNQGYQTASKNQQAIEIFQTGGLSPGRPDTEILLNMMDFDDKDKVLKLLREAKNDMLQQALQTIEQMQVTIEELQKGGGQPGAFRPPVMQQAAGEEPVA